MMPRILREERKDFGGVEVWCVADADWPTFKPSRDACYVFYFADGRYDDRRLEELIAARKADAAESARRAAVDDALLAELERRKTEIVDLYERDPEDAADAVFAREAAPIGGRV